jgi:hypothetical protein
MLSFAWKIRERTTIYVTLLTLLLAALMGLFFVVFRITYPSVQTADAVPQRVLVLDPSDPEALALIHRAQDKSFGLVPAEPVDLTAKAHFPSFTPSYGGFELKLRTMVPPAATPRQPKVFSASTPVLPEVLKKNRDGERRAIIHHDRMAPGGRLLEVTSIAHQNGYAVALATVSPQQ